jgi:hypothetical protein
MNLSGVMESKEIIRLFEIIEKKTGVLKYEIEGWNVWGILRTRIGFNLLGRNVSKKKRVLFYLRLFPQIFGFLKSIFSFYRIPYSKKGYDLLIRTTTDAKRDFVEGKYKDVYFDDILINSSFKSFVIEDLGVMEDLGKKIHFNPVLRKPDFFSEGLRILSKFKRVKLKKEELRGIKKEILSELENLKIKEASYLCSFLEINFERIILDFFKTKEVYKSLFKKVNPKIFFLTAPYGNEAIVAAAKEQGIKVVELQHGMIYNHHLGYIYGKHLLDYKDSFPIPDYLLTYGEYWKKLLEKNTFRSKKELISVGNTRIYFWNSKINSEEKVFRNIFIASIGRVPDKMVEIVDKTLDILDKQEIKIKFSVKLHPGEDISSLKKWKKLKIKHKNLEIIGGYALNFYESLLKSDFHVSVYSSTHYESINLGKPTAVLNVEGWENVKELINSDVAKLISSPNDFVRLINSALKKDKFYQKWLFNTKNKRKDYQEENATEKNVRIIKNLLKN